MTGELPAAARVRRPAASWPFRLVAPAGLAGLTVLAVLSGCSSLVAGDGMRRSGGPHVEEAATGAVLRAGRDGDAAGRALWPLRGSERWRLRYPARAGQVAGFTTRVSAPAGVPVDLRVSTTARRYRVTAYRIGWYRGGTGRAVWRSGPLRGLEQRPPEFADLERRTVVAPWRRTSLVETERWVPGVYVFKLDTGRWEAHVPYVVRSPTAVGRVVMVAPVTTWQAYNDWGGYSLYTGPAGDRRAWAVSFDRPYPAPGSAELMFGVVPLVVAAERAGLSLAYLTNLDLHTHPGALQGARAYVSMGHDEYWTPRMRRVVENARDDGVNLAFFGANTMYWRIRLTSGPIDHPDHNPPRVLVGYRSDAQVDPVTDPRRRTGLFRDGPDPRAGENALTGMQYECFPVDEPYRVVAPRWWGFSGTGVRAGETFPHLVGVEADRVYPLATTPRPLQVLSHVEYTCGGVLTSAQSVYYTQRSGAGVFNAGTLRWTCALVDRCRPHHLGDRTLRFVRRVTVNILREFARGPAARLHPAIDTVARFALPRRNQVPAS